MSNVLIISCGVLALLYGLYATRSVLAAPAGNERMQEIATAIQEGARAYLNRQYLTIGIVGIVVGPILGIFFGLPSAITCAIALSRSTAASNDPPAAAYS